MDLAPSSVRIDKASVEDFISQAEGYLELEMFEEAWHAIDGLPSEERTNPRALRVRMFAAFAIGRHEAAEVLARLLSATESPERKAAGFILSQLAGIHLAAGDEGKARELVKAAIHADPDQAGGA